MKKDAKAVLDASAALAIIQDEPGADRLAPILHRAVIGSVNVAEVLGKLVQKGIPSSEALAAVAALHLEQVTFSPEDAEATAAYVVKGISLGDRCFLACAARCGEGFTSDRALLKLTGAPALHCIR